jgi:hypothetical protein
LELGIPRLVWVVLLLWQDFPEDGDVEKHAENAGHHVARLGNAVLLVVASHLAEAGPCLAEHEEKRHANLPLTDASEIQLHL